MGLESGGPGGGHELVAELQLTGPAGLKNCCGLRCQASLQYEVHGRRDDDSKGGWQSRKCANEVSAVRRRHEVSVSCCAIH
jgi:hypothetical protein